MGDFARRLLHLVQRTQSNRGGQPADWGPIRGGRWRMASLYLPGESHRLASWQATEGGEAIPRTVGEMALAGFARFAMTQKLRDDCFIMARRAGRRPVKGERTFVLGSPAEGTRPQGKPCPRGVYTIFGVTL